MEFAERQIMLKIFTLERYRNKEINSVIQGIQADTDVGTVFVNLLSIRTYTNDEMTGILKVLKVFLLQRLASKNNLAKDEESLVETMMGVKFVKTDRDVEVSLIVYFELLLLFKKLGAHASLDIFYKFYLACSDKSIRMSVRESVYRVFEEILHDKTYLATFVAERLYVGFPFLHDFVLRFAKVLSSAEVHELCFYLAEAGDFYLTSILVDTSVSIYVLNHCLLAPRSMPLLRFHHDFYNVPFIYHNFDRHFLLNNLSEEYFCRVFSDSLAQYATQALRRQAGRKTCGFCAEEKKSDRLARALDEINTSKNVTDFDGLVFRFLRYARETSLTNLGTFLSKERNRGAMEVFLNTFSFKALDPLSALRLFLSAFILPGESEVIYRVLEMFNEKYCRDQEDLDSYFEDAQHTSSVAKSSIGCAELPIRDLVSAQGKAEAADRPDDCADNVVKYDVDINDIQGKEFLDKKKDAIFFLTYALVALNTHLHNPIANINPTFKQFSDSLKPHGLRNDILLTSYNSIKGSALRYTEKNEFSRVNYDIFLSLCTDLGLHTIYNFEMCLQCIGEPYRRLITKDYRNIIKRGISADLLSDLCDALDLKVVICEMILCLGTELLGLSELDRKKTVQFFEVFIKYFNDLGEFVRSEPDETISPAAGTAQAPDLPSTHSDEKNAVTKNPFVLPFLIFGKILEFKASQKYTLLKVIRKSSQKKALLNYESIYLAFVNSTESLCDTNLVRLIACMDNYLPRSPLILDIFFDISLSNCHRIKLCKLANFSEENLLALAERCVELNLHDSFVFVAECIDTNNLFAFVAESFKEKGAFYTGDTLSFVLTLVERTQSPAAFDLVVALQSTHDLFGFVVEITTSEVVCTVSHADSTSPLAAAESKEHALTNNAGPADKTGARKDVFMAYALEEKFKSILSHKNKLFKFTMSSSSVINAGFLSKFFRSSTSVCIVDSELSLDADVRLIYLLMKADHMNDDDVLRYALWIFNLCSASLPFVTTFLARNFGLMLQLKNKMLLLSISKILASRVQKVVSGEPACAEGCRHEGVMASAKKVVELLCSYEIVDASVFALLDSALDKHDVEVFHI